MNPNLKLMNLTKQIEFYLDKYGITATQLAKRANLPKQTLSNWLSGQKPKDITQVKKLAEALATSVDNLCFGSGEDMNAVKETELDALLGDSWVSGLFEVKFRRVKK